MRKENPYNIADYNALLASNISKAMVENGRFDSAEDASVFFARELDQVKSKTYDRQYPELSALNHFPQTSEINPGADTFTFYSYDEVGLAEIISNYSTDLPRVDVFGTPKTVKIRSLGDAYGYSVQEMRAAAFAGKSLDASKASAARRAIETKHNRIAFVGDAASGLVGVFSSDNGVPRYTIPNGAAGDTKWAKKTAQEIINDVSGMHEAVDEMTNSVEKPDTLMIASNVYALLSRTIISGTAVSVLSFIRDNLDWLKEIIPAPELNAKNTSCNPTGENLAFLYTNDPEKFSVETPMPFYQHPAQNKNLEVEIACESRVAGATFYYPLSAIIGVGI